MTKNVGSTEKTLRIILALIIAGAGYYYQSWWGLVALVPLFTAFASYCPLWTLFGINTCNKKEE